MGGRRFKFLLRFGIVINLLFGFVSNRVPKTPPIQLNRILEESALLSVHITSNNTVSIVKWIFHPRQGEANDLGRFSDGKWVRWNTSDSFGQRLEMVDGTTLKISNLVVKDSGNYTAHVTFSTGVTESHTFGLTVYGAVANPKKAPLHQVTGMAGKPVLFPLNITSGETVLMIKWDLYPRNGTPFELAVLRNGQLRTSNLKDMDRLDVLNETTLRIKALQENETGVLKSRVTYTTSKMEIFSFNLTVSVPAPESNPPDVPSVSQSEGGSEWRQ